MGPTVIGQKGVGKSVKVSVIGNNAGSISVSKPSSIPGIVVETMDALRHRLTVQFPDKSASVIEKVCELSKNGVTLDNLSGILLELKKRYKGTVDEFVLLTQSQDTHHGIRNLGRLLNILQEIDMGFESSFWKKSDPWKIYSDNLTEIMQLIKLLENY